MSFLNNTVCNFVQIEDFASEAMALLEDVKRAGLAVEGLTIYTASYTPMSDTKNRYIKESTILKGNMHRQLKNTPRET
jgi:hypothetical protein